MALNFHISNFVCNNAKLHILLTFHFLRSHVQIFDYATTKHYPTQLILVDDNKLLELMCAREDVTYSLQSAKNSSRQVSKMFSHCYSAYVHCPE